MRQTIQLALSFFVLLVAGPLAAQSQSVAIGDAESSATSESSVSSEASDASQPEASTSDSSSDNVSTSGGDEDERSACETRKARFTRSAARKLTRSMGASRSVRPHDLSKSLTISLGGGERTFNVYSEYEGKGAALTESGKNVSIAAVMTTQGPIVTTLRWDTGCGVESTFLAVPSGPEIAFEPFRHWGNRIQWRLPNSLDRDLSLKDAITKALSSM